MSTKLGLKAEDPTGGVGAAGAPSTTRHHSEAHEPGIVSSLYNSQGLNDTYLEGLIVGPVLLPLGLDGLVLVPRREWTVRGTGRAAQGRGNPCSGQEAPSFSPPGRHSGTSTRRTPAYQPLECACPSSLKQQHDDDDAYQ